jgi:Carbohydrate-selective porin, OprB family/S-layer homology domain
MINFFKLCLGQSCTVFGLLLMMVSVVIAQESSENLLEQVDPYSDRDPMSQLTSVSELKDVAPTEWAYEALRSLVERYGCIVGYPDSTFRGNRAITRWEFAAGLNACLNTIERLTQENVAVLKKDVDILKRLAREFETELAALGGRVDNLESRVAYLEDHQFSTTTKLTGQVLFAVAGAFGGDKANSDESVDDNIFFSDRVRLLFNTSFTGSDRLLIRMQAGTTPDLSDATGTNMTRFAFTSPTDNDVVINQLDYWFPIGDKGTVFIEAIGFLDLFVPTLHPLDGDYNTVISGFSLRSPIYFQSGLTGAGFNYEFTDWLSVGGGYLAGDPTANDPNTGLFNGPYGALAQVTFRPTEELAFAFTYLNGYDDGSGNAPPGGFFGSENSTFPFGADEDTTLPPEAGEETPATTEGVPVSYNSYGFEAQYSFSPNFSLSGWVGLTQAEAKKGANRGADADILYWAVVLSFPDLGKEGNLGGLIFGQPSKVTSNDVEAFEDEDTSFLIEAFYRYRLTDNISITPGLVVVTSPEHNDDNDTNYIGVIRTVFDF